MTYSTKTIPALQDGANAIKEAATKGDWAFLELLVKQSGLTLSAILVKAMMTADDISDCISRYQGRSPKA